MPFLTLGLTANIVRAATRCGFETPSPVQTQAIPVILSGRDALVSAQTGSGKTLAYGLPLLQFLAASPQSSLRSPGALVLVPTRELAVQVGETLRNVANQMEVNLRISVVFGGVSINPQLLKIRGGTNLIVATPGRLLDLVSHNALDLSTVKHWVLDEADRLLDLGFEEELGAIKRLLVREKQILLFSATFPPLVMALGQSLLRQPISISVAAEPHTAPDIAQRAVLVETGRRTQLLRHLIQVQKWERILVFVATKHAAEIVADKLRKSGTTSEPFHGELSQGKRTQVLSDFKASRLQVVVATDMASRGLDIQLLPVVVNYDLPRAAQDYTHRIGRTGRAGESGLAFTFVTPATQSHWRMITKKNGLALTLETIDGFEPRPENPALSPVLPGAPGNGGVKGKRPNKKDRLKAAARAP